MGGDRLSQRLYHCLWGSDRHSHENRHPDSDPNCYLYRNCHGDHYSDWNAYPDRDRHSHSNVLFYRNLYGNRNTLRYSHPDRYFHGFAHGNRHAGLFLYTDLDPNGHRFQHRDRLPHQQRDLDPHRNIDLDPDAFRYPDQHPAIYGDGNRYQDRD